MMRKVKLKQLSKVELPREKLEKYGAKKLADYELLAVVLGSGIKGINVLELSKKILKLIKKVSTEKISLNELVEVKGLGKAKALQILSIIALGERFTADKPEILSALNIWTQCAGIRDSKREHFVAFYLDTQNRLIERQIISIGTLNTSLVHPREVFEPAIKLSAATIIVAHNHPSGDTTPSIEDKEITKRLVDSGKILGVEIIDHIILSKTGYLSFQEKGLL